MFRMNANTGVGPVVYNQDFLSNAGGTGETGEALYTLNTGKVSCDPGLRRPYYDERGRAAVKLLTGRMVFNKETKRHEPEREKVLVKDLREAGYDDPVLNSTTLRKDEWIRFDQAVVRSSRQRLRAWADLMSVGSVNFDGMSKMTYEYEAVNDPGEAVVDMEGITDGRTSSPLYKLRSVPLPITHSDFWFSQRRIMTSRNGGSPLDTSMAEFAGRRVAEMVEKTLIGVETGIQFGPTSTSDTRYDGTSKVYGYTNAPGRITKTDLNTPTGSNPEAVKQDIIEMREQMYALGYYGPFVVYHTPAYDAFLDDDYFRTGATTGAMAKTLRQRVMEIEGITAVRRLDFWNSTSPSAYQLLMVQLTPDWIQAINGMDITLVQWDSQGGMRKNWKVMCIHLPIIKREFNGNSPVLHATTA